MTLTEVPRAPSSSRRPVGAQVSNFPSAIFSVAPLSFSLPDTIRRGADCFHCHGGVLFTDFGYRDNGIGGATSDAGRGGVNGRETDRRKFKTPSLRNVALTAPYMHDGHFATLEQVVSRYDHGVSRTAVLDPNFAKHPNEGLQLGAEDKRAFVAFLRTLTDARFQR